MIIFWVCSSVTLIGAVIATFAGDLRYSILALWLAGLGAGGVYLSLGAEFLAVIQWLVSTLLTIGFLVHAVTFGEYGEKDPRKNSKKLLSAILPAILGTAFPLMIWTGVAGLPIAHLSDPVAGPDLLGLGRALVGRHLLSIELLLVVLFVVVIGAGVIARPDSREEG